MSLLKQESVREGFLCPICVQDLGSFQKLQTHFEDVHSSEDKEVFKQLKGFFSKAKGKFFGQDENETRVRSVEGASSSQAPQPEVGRIIWEPQELGQSRSHFESFKKFRDDRIDRFVVESNKVLIRLEKLTRNSRMSGQPNSKDFEKSLVYWVSDDDVPFCPSCGNRFGIAKRRHHCRLCGSIMCSKCSNFVTHEFADDLVTTLQTLSPGNSTSQFSRPRARSVDTTIKNQGNHQNLMQTRICIECLKILSKRKERKDQKENQSQLLLYYEKLQSSIQQANQLSPEYERMADSLNSGEEDFQLDQAQELRIRLVRFFEVIDVVSKKIVSLGQMEDSYCGPRETRLISNIRRASHAYLQDNMLTLRSLPSLPKLEKLQMERRKEKELMRRREQERMERERADARRQQEIERLKQERQAVERERKIQQQQQQQQRKDETANVVKGGGWIGSTKLNNNAAPAQNPFDINNQDEGGSDSSDADSHDPILEQIGNVERMLRQAESVGMHEEANSLRQNLSELRAEHKRVVSRAFGGFGVTSQQQRQQRQQQQVPTRPAVATATKQQAPPARPATVAPTKQQQASSNRTGRKNPFEIIAEKNPFLSNNSSPTKSSSSNQKRFLSPLRNRNPFVKPKNPFLDDDDDDDVVAGDDSKNPFLNGDGDEEQGHVFRRGDQRRSESSSVGGGEMKDPMLEQICYITKCLDEAVKIGKHDEAAMLRQNLKELQAAYQGNS